LSGKPDLAVAEARRAVELDSTNPASLSLLGAAYRAAGRTADQLSVARRLVSMIEDPRRLGIAGGTLARGGAQAEGRAVLARIEALPPRAPGRNAGLAIAYLGFADTARALSAMERAAAMTGGDLLFATVPSDPVFDAVRSSPRFAAVLKHFNMNVALLTGPRGGRPQ